MRCGIILFIIIIKTVFSEGGLKSHAELIRQAIKADKMIMALAYNITGFANNNPQFKKYYENLRNPSILNYTSLHSKFIQIREFESYNKERLDLENNIVLALSKQRLLQHCRQLRQIHRKLLISKLTDSNAQKLDALRQVDSETCGPDPKISTVKSTIKLPAVFTTNKLFKSSTIFHSKISTENVNTDISFTISTTHIFTTTRSTHEFSTTIKSLTSNTQPITTSINTAEISDSKENLANIDDYDFLQDKIIHYLNKYHDSECSNNEFTMMKDKLKLGKKLKRHQIHKLSKIVSDFETYDKRRLELEEIIRERINELNELIPYEEPKSKCQRYYLLQKDNLNRGTVYFNDLKEKKIRENSQNCPYSDTDEDNDDDDYSLAKA